MLFQSSPLFALVLASAAVAVQCADSASKWDDSSVSEPKDLVVNGFGLGCSRQLIFKRGGVSSSDQSWSYSVVGLKDKSSDPPAELRQNSISRNAPLSVVNASAGHFRGAYRLDNDKDYALLPIQFDGCNAGAPYDLYQLKATKPGKTTWFSTPQKVKSFAAPDQVLNLKATRDATEKSKVHVSWETYESQSGTSNDRPLDSFVIAGKSNVKDMLVSQFVEAGKMEATIDVGPLPVNVTVVRYDSKFSGGLSFLDNTPQVQVLLEL